MKKINSLIVLVICTIALTSSFAQGVYIEYKITAGDGKESMSGNNKSYYQNGNSRNEMNMSIPGLPAGAFNTITITRKDKPNTIIKLNPSDKSYTEMTFEEYEREEPRSNEPFEITVIGKETVNGYNSTHFIAKYKNSGKVRNEWWTSKEVPGFTGFSGMKGSKYLDDDNLFSKMAEKGVDGFPVRIKMSESAMRGSFQMDVIKAEKKDIPESMFEIPATYTKAATMDMNGLMNNMKNMQNMSPEEQQKMLQEMMKMYQGQMPAEKP
ncbi:MAG: hypothetical protein POELPBGB_00927 [Bacteroidia bacterium]|nr:hypothetical protein [Bacteroidia bacterium]